MVAIDRDGAAEVLAEILPKSAHKHINTIIDEFTVPSVGAVETVGARVELERVKVFGLEVGLDGYGNAVRVSFPYGAEVTEWV